ncbi:MAG TPA: precorrin-3B C(17)-methyltransferase, partial [Cyanobacteria bacterium UBA11049]|nr:precorrin-3B C(17)-methyltransferase [Cyanobacteria bacterium UBA11049]
MNYSLFEDFQPLSAIATTPSGAKKLQPFCQASGATLWLPESLNGVERAQFYPDPLKTHIANLWHSHRALVFCLATGAVVRLIAPLLQHKSSDPAVVVIDEAGKFVISLCSGHQGGADKLSFAIAKVIGATPVLTSASASAGLTAVDLLGVPFGWYKGEGDWTGVSAAIARGERVQVIQDAGSTLWRSTASFGRSNFSFEESPQTKAKIWITPYNSVQTGLPETTAQLQSSPNPPLPQVQWHPRVLWVGIGCERGTSRQ